MVSVYIRVSASVDGRDGFGVDNKKGITVTDAIITDNNIGVC